MKNFLRFMLVAAMLYTIAAGCSKRDGLTSPAVNTPVVSVTYTYTGTSTEVVTVNTSTPTDTATEIVVNTNTYTMTATEIVIGTLTDTATQTATRTATQTVTISPTVTVTSTITVTSTASETSTATATVTITTTEIPTALATVIGGVAQVTPVLGTSARFAVLSFSDLTNIPSSSITGDVGISPGARSNIVGLLDGDGQVASGYAIYASDDLVPAGTAAMLTQAYDDAGAAYLDAVNASRGTPTSLVGNINGLTLAPGLYESGSSIEISAGGIVYLDGMGDPNAVFVIRSATTITTESTSQVVLTGNAQAQNVFWVAGSAITLGTNSVMKGTLIASTSISLLNMADLNGRAIIQSASAGQISLSQNIVVLP